MSEPKKIGYIRTSDRASFKRCRRKWKWNGSMGSNLQEDYSRGPLWGGTGFHYALEDYHGYKNHSSASDAFKAYVMATRKAPGQGVPGDFEELTELFCGMVDYYANDWLGPRDTLQTYWIDGVPQVEVRFLIEIPVPQELLDAAGYEKIYYQGTIDRVVIDEQGRLWILDHKTAASMVINHFETDPQITSYCWAAESGLFDKPIEGFIYQQYKKAIPVEPEPLKTGKISTAKTLATTHALYKRALINLYGDPKNAPKVNLDYLNGLAAAETSNEDKFIRRDYIFRSQPQLESEGARILLEAQDMIDPNLPIYTNATRDCSWDCAFLNPCVLMDCGDDWKEELELSTIQRNDLEATWRNYL
ncbi:MAG: PD-(D/E)XK nuclease family protein [Nitrosopumilus sp.]